MNNPLLNDNESNHKRMIWTLTENGDCRLWGIDYDKHRFIDQYQNDKIQLPTDSMIMNKLPPKSAKKKKKEDPFINLLKSQSKKNKDKSMDRGVLLSYFNVNTIQTKNKLERNGTIVSNYQANKSRKFQEMQKTKKFRKKIFPTKYGMNKGKINCMKGHYDVTQFPWIAIGGNERPVEVYDFNKQKCIFKGKHHKHWLGHRHEIIINDIDFCKKSVNPYLCAAVTQQSDLKLYDVRANKSIFAQKIGDYSLNKVLIKSKQKILIGDSNANIFEFDYLKPSRERGYVYRRYRGFVGAIRDFDIHPTRNLLATVGLGRYVVVHRLNQPHLPLFKTYCKQKLNAVLFGATYDTKYLPKEEIEEKNDDEKEENKSENNEVDNFLDDTEDEEEEDENQDEDEDLDESEENGDDDKRSYLLEALADDDDDGDWNERLDGYDTDELEDLLEEMKNQRQFEHDGPPSKRRKMR